MKCHICNKELIPRNTVDFISLSPEEHAMHCPDDHCEIYYKCNYGDKFILEYKLMWDADDKAKERYWIYSWNSLHGKSKNKFNNGTIINMVTYGRPYKEKKMLDFPDFIPLKIKDDTIQIDNIVPRLNKLKAFI